MINHLQHGPKIRARPPGDPDPDSEANRKSQALSYLWAPSLYSINHVSLIAHSAWHKKRRDVEAGENMENKGHSSQVHDHRQKLRPPFNQHHFDYYAKWQWKHARNSRKQFQKHIFGKQWVPGHKKITIIRKQKQKNPSKCVPWKCSTVWRKSGKLPAPSCVCVCVLYVHNYRVHCSLFLFDFFFCSILRNPNLPSATAPPDKPPKVRAKMQFSI